MGNGGIQVAKELAPVVVRSLPQIIAAFQMTTATSNNKKEDKKIEEALRRMDRDRNDIDNLVENQAQLAEALTLLINRLQNDGANAIAGAEAGANSVVGAVGVAGGQSKAKIRIEMDLPENVADRDEALHNFWRNLATVAAAQSQEYTSPITGAGKPLEQHFQATPPSNQHLCCQICTLRYNEEERSPTLLPDCGHTFCKECLRKANRRNHCCPTCRKESNINVDNHPTNHSILQFLKEEEDEDANLKEKECTQSTKLDELSFEKQLEIACRLSLEDNSIEDDFNFAKRLQEEEYRLGRFAHHGDRGMKSEMVNNDNRDVSRVRKLQHWEEDTRYHYDGDHNHIGNAVGNIYPENINMTEDYSDGDDGDCHLTRQLPNDLNYSEARKMQNELEEVKSCCDDDDCKKVYQMCDEYDDEQVNENNQRNVDVIPREDNDRRSSTTQERQDEEHPNPALLNDHSPTFYQEEKERMLERAQSTYEKDKEIKKKRRMLKEQEKLDLAFAISLSECTVQIDHA